MVPSGRIWQAAQDREFIAVTSASIIAEVFRSLSSLRIQRRYAIQPGDIQRVQTYLDEDVGLTPLSRRVHGVATHPEDDLILSAAISADADYLVTGDFQLQKLGSVEGIRIVSPRVFLEVLETAPS